MLSACWRTNVLSPNPGSADLHHLVDQVVRITHPRPPAQRKFNPRAAASRTKTSCGTPAARANRIARTSNRTEDRGPQTEDRIPQTNTADFGSDLKPNRGQVRFEVREVRRPQTEDRAPQTEVRGCPNLTPNRDPRTSNRTEVRGTQNPIEVRGPKLGSPPCRGPPCTCPHL